MQRLSSKGYRAFLLLLGITIAVWVMRGFGLITFIPGGILWLLILATVGLGVFSTIQRSKRW